MKDGERFWRVQLAQVPLITSEGNYARLTLDGHEPLRLRSLTSLEERLDPARCFRSSRQHRINLDFIESLEPAGPSGTLVARLRSGREVEMSRRQLLPRGALPEVSTALSTEATPLPRRLS
ncbi:LytTR family DNA-binding domain-containing protein [Myxococcus sp. NMCA1]|uniref:LytTR family DNA-binding domain-containing protein n=1 Tax=Myxococcus sp. NMCA1 TaxID=2996785 RepID=UPI002286B655|nr:LytTR family DNA-binding domain-containing protein [Myxococcus sp. NMCA1]WAM26873.1 LytTR family DNA-binding domain-containing protein [Myxococcus sp. NMCA1]